MTRYVSKAEATASGALLVTTDDGGEWVVPVEDARKYPVGQEVTIKPVSKRRKEEQE